MQNETLSIYQDIRNSYFAPIDLSYEPRPVSCSQDALAQYLAEYSWDYWFTATSRDKDSCRYPTVALRRATWALCGLSRGFVAAEPHYLGGWHTHGIFTTTVDPGEKESIRRIVEHDLSTFGFARVESARSLQAVSRYLSKYVTKEHTSEWKLIGSAWHWKTEKLPLT